MKENIDKYNLIKSISIFLVVCIHVVYKFFTADSKPFAFDLYNYITSFGVPFFLILGGFFFSKKFLNTKRNFTSKVLINSSTSLLKRLIIPFYFFVLLLTAYNLLIGKDVLWSQFLFIDSNENGLYFVIIYVYSSVFSLFFLYLLRNKTNPWEKTRIVIPLISLVLFPITSYLVTVFPHNAVISQLPYICFFSFGIPLFFLNQYIEEKYTKNHCNFKILILLSIILFLYTVCLYFARKFFGNFPVFTSGPPPIFRMIYCLLLFQVSLILLSSKSITYFVKKIFTIDFGVNSLFIFFIHPYFIKIFIAPVINLFCSTISFNIHQNIFIIPVIITAYLITYLSNLTFLILPIKFQKFFSR